MRFLFAFLASLIPSVAIAAEPIDLGEGWVLIVQPDVCYVAIGSGGASPATVLVGRPKAGRQFFGVVIPSQIPLGNKVQISLVYQSSPFSDGVVQSVVGTSVLLTKFGTQVRWPLDASMLDRLKISNLVSYEGAHFSGTSSVKNLSRVLPILERCQKLL